MSDETKMDEIQGIAYQLWEEAGQPEGRDKEFWEQAQKQVLSKNNEESEFNKNQEENPPKPILKNPVISEPKK